MPHDFWLVVGGLLAVFSVLIFSLAYGSYQTGKLHH
jgi:hypothetical protein